MHTAVVDFFQVIKHHSGGPSFRDALDSAMQLPDDEARTKDPGSDDPLRLQGLWKRGRRFEGELVRIRMSDVPPKVATDGNLKNIDLEDNEGIGERSAWLAIPDRDLIAIERSRFIRRGAYASYLGHVVDGDQIFELVPVLRADAYRRFASFKEIRGIKIRVASPDPEAMSSIGKTPRSFVNLMNELDAPVLEVSYSLGRGRSTPLHFKNARKLVQDLFRRRSNIDKLEVSGKEDPDTAGVDHFDLLRFAIRARVPIDVGRERTVPYEARRDAVRVAFDKERKALEEALE